MSRAIPIVSKPGPRFADVAGTRTTTLFFSTYDSEIGLKSISSKVHLKNLHVHGLSSSYLHTIISSSLSGSSSRCCIFRSCSYVRTNESLLLIGLFVKSVILLGLNGAEAAASSSASPPPLLSILRCLVNMNEPAMKNVADTTLDMKQQCFSLIVLSGVSSSYVMRESGYE